MTTARQSITVIGGAQAGLATSYQLSRLGLEHVVLDASEHAGDTWRHRWDSLSLFTPARIDHLDGMVLPGSGGPPTKDDFADYLDRYEQEFALPVRHGVRVERLSSDAAGYALSTTAGADAFRRGGDRDEQPAAPPRAAVRVRAGPGDPEPALLRVPQSRSAQTGAMSWSSARATLVRRSASRSHAPTRRGSPARRAGICRSGSTGSSVVRSGAGSSPSRSCTSSTPAPRSAGGRNR